jgi:hypothetical protein
MNNAAAWSVTAGGIVLEVLIALLDEWVDVPHISFHIGNDGVYFINKEG